MYMVESPIETRSALMYTGNITKSELTSTHINAYKAQSFH